MEVIIPIGISGSGKSRLYNKKYSDFALLSPDEIRRKLTGNVSDQKCNNLVFKEVDKMVNDFVKTGTSFFYDATNCNPKFRKEFVEKFRGTDVKVIYLVFPADVKVSFERITSDIETGVDRSVVPMSVLKRQISMYDESVDSKFRGENVQEIVYLKDEDLN